MAITKERIQQFFANYEARTNRALGDQPKVDVDEAVGAFTDCFIEASPTGVMCGTNNNQFREQVEKGYQFYRSIGTQWMKARAVEVTLLDDFHAMAKIHWEALYKKQDDSEESIEFDVIYFVQMLDEQPKIFAFIAGDEQKVYEQKGIVPYKS